MADASLYLKPVLSDSLFPIRISCQHFEKSGTLFTSHWHEQIELLYFTGGEASIKFNSTEYKALPGDLLVANSNELHSGQGLTGNVSYYCMIIDTSILRSSFFDCIDTEGAARSSSYTTLLMNRVSKDRYVRKCMCIIEKEQARRLPGYELAVKSTVLRMITFLMRRYAHELLTPQKYDTRLRNMNKLNKVLEYIEEMHTENITIEIACKLVNLSPYYFCRLFRNSTGRTFTEYVNHVRMNKAEMLLRNTELSISEIALNTGFNDANYFSRMFRKYKKISPSNVRLDKRVNV